MACKECGAIVDPLEAVLAHTRRLLAAPGRDADFVTLLGGPEFGYVLYWGRIERCMHDMHKDERYIVSEVCPSRLDDDGAIVWARVAGGRENAIAWNVAEGIERTHKLPAGEVVLVREELDRDESEEFRAIFHCVPAETEAK